MKKLKFTKENISITLILIISAILNFANIGIEGYGNGYYAAGIKSMTMSLKNFFFVSFDPGSFVTIDKPPMGFWIQAIFAKIFGFSGWSILLPQAIAGVISVYLVYYLVKRSFGTVAGLMSAIFLTVTPVFVAASRNNTIDNLLVVTLLFACLALSSATEKGKARYLYLSLILVGIGFNIKMLEAYMIGPAIYITYLLSSNVSFKKRIGRLIIGSVILVIVSLSWAITVDLIPSENRPYIGSSTDNSVMELIIGHNGLERLGLSGKSGRGFGGNNTQDGGQRPSRGNNGEIADNSNDQSNIDGDNQERMVSGAPSGNNPEMSRERSEFNNSDGGNRQGMSGRSSDGNNQGDDNNMNGNGQGGTPGGQGAGPGGQGGLQGSFGGETKAGITRLFSKNSLSDQIIWFLPLALLGFIAGAIKEKLRFKLDNKRKSSLVLWFVWLVPEFIYFSYTTGLFHPYYLTMMAPPAAALSGIGIGAMWEFYKEGKWKSWLLPITFVVEGITHMIMLSYYTSNMSNAIRNIILVGLILCFVSSAILSILNILNFIKRKDNNNLNSNKNLRLNKILVGIAFIGILITPFVGASAAITHTLNETIPCAGLELLSNNGRSSFGGGNIGRNSAENTKLIDFLESNKTNEKYLLVVSSSQSADNIIIQTGEPVMALGGFSGSDKILSLDEFKEMVKNGEVRYVLTGGMGRGGSSDILSWVTENGTEVPESEYKDTTTSNSEPGNNKDEDTSLNNSEYKENSNANVQDRNDNSRGQNVGGFGGNNSEKLYDLKDVANTLK